MRLFTTFIATALVFIFSESGITQTLPHSVVIRPTNSVLHPAKNTIPTARPNSIFIDPNQNIPLLSPLVLPHDSALFYVDTSDQTKLSVDRMPSFINIDTSTPSGSKPPVPDTLIGYGEHFTSPYAATKTYLDSVQFVIAVTNVGAITDNYIRIRASKSKTNANGIPFPSTTVDSVDITNLNDLLSADPQNPSFYIETVHMHNKLVGSKEFFVTIESAFDPAQSLMPADLAQNQIFLESDQQDFTTFNAKIQRGYGISLADGNRDNFSLVWAGITNTNHQTPYYSNFWIVAYVSDLPTNGVTDSKLSGNALAQNYPNPFNPSTVIKYSLEKEAKVSIKLYNALGLEVATILNANEPAGENQVTFSGDNLPSGTYFYTMKAGTFSQTKRMVLSK